MVHFPEKLGNTFQIDKNLYDLSRPKIRARIGNKQRKTCFLGMFWRLKALTDFLRSKKVLPNCEPSRTYSTKPAPPLLGFRAFTSSKAQGGVWGCLINYQLSTAVSQSSLSFL